MTESLMQQIQEAMNGGKKRVKRVKRVKKAAKAVRKPTGVVRKAAAAKPKRRVVRRTPMKFMGGFFAELNNMVTAEGGAGDGADKKKAMAAMAAMAAMPPVGTTGPVGMEGGRRFVYRKPVAKKAKAPKAVAKKPLFGSRGRMSYGGYEEMEEQVEEQEVEQEQEGGRRKPRVVRRRRAASPARRRAASPARRR
jgi:hypothetical protein